MTNRRRRPTAAVIRYDWKKETFKDNVLRAADCLASARALTFDRPTRARLSAIMRRLNDLAPR